MNRCVVRQQLLGEYLQIQLVGLAYRLNGFQRPGVHAMTGTCDGSSHGSNRVAVAAERGRRQAGLPRVLGMQREHGEGGRYRFLRRQAGPTNSTMSRTERS